MAVSNRKEIFSADLETVWGIVTDLENASWRSDLDRIEVLGDGKSFIEYTKDGFSTKFTITVFEPYSRYEFDMENDNLTGHWTGVFKETAEGVRLDFTEEAAVKKFFMKPFAAMFLKKQQETYFDDLRNALKNI